jgi:hypothetical protein
LHGKAAIEHVPQQIVVVALSGEERMSIMLKSRQGHTKGLMQPTLACREFVQWFRTGIQTTKCLPVHQYVTIL